MCWLRIIASIGIEQEQHSPFTCLLYFCCTDFSAATMFVFNGLDFPSFQRLRGTIYDVSKFNAGIRSAQQKKVGMLRIYGEVLCSMYTFQRLCCDVCPVLLYLITRSTFILFWIPVTVCITYITHRQTDKLDRYKVWRISANILTSC